MSSPEAENKKDCWYGVQDAKARKQIQDRLAQRARRKRLAEAKSHMPSPPTDTSATEICRTSRHKDKAMVRVRRNPPVVQSIPIDPSVDTFFIASPIQTLYSALFENGVILGLTCATCNISVSKSPQPHHPIPLHPTQMQLTVVHYEMIDRIPIPGLRDRIIYHSDTFDMESFIGYFTTRPIFNFKPGFVSWDPKGWVPTSNFRLDYPELFA